MKFASRYLSFALLSIGLIAATTGCLSIPHSGCEQEKPLSPSEISALLSAFATEPALTQLNEGRLVFRTPRGEDYAGRPPILLLHEYPYLSPQTMGLAQRLADRGFAVYVPTLFGRPLVRQLVANSWYLFTNPEWKVGFQQNETSPIVKPMRNLVSAISARHGGQNVGVIGMCLTGSTALVLGADEHVSRIVVAQPATPLLAWTASARRALGITPDDWSNTRDKARAGKLSVFGMRFENDTTSTPERFARLTADLGDAFQGVIIPHDDYAKWGIDEHAHPVLTYCIPNEYRKRENPIIDAYERMVQFLAAANHSPR